MTPDDRWIDRARFDAEHAKRVWAGSADVEDAPAWYGRVATLIRGAAAPATEDELAGEADIVARMQAAILEPAPDVELDGELDIVAQMQATILDLRASTDSDAADEDDRPRHLRAAGEGRDGARRRARVVGRIVAAKAAAVTTVVAIGVTAAAATTGIVATVVVPALTSHDPKPLRMPEPPPAAESGSGDAPAGVDGGDDGSPPSTTVITLESGQPLACMFRLDCLMGQVEEKTGVPPGGTDSKVTPGAAAEAPPTETTVSDPDAPVSPPPETPPTTAAELPPEPPTTTTPTTEPPPTTTTPTTEPPPTTTTPTTEPQPVEAAAVPAPTTPPAVELAASTGDPGGAPDITAAGLPAGGAGDVRATTTEPPPAG